jgi:hypothetical protein
MNIQNGHTWSMEMFGIRTFPHLFTAGFTRLSFENDVRDHTVWRRMADDW